jgi:hypothetical protein
VFTPTDVAGVVAAGSRNRWIPWSAITRATLRTGKLDYRMYLEVGDRSHMFLWLQTDGGRDLLAAALERALPGRVTVSDEPTTFFSS